MSQDHFRGSLLGLAACDALGTTLEFKPPGTFKPLTDIVGGGPFGLKPGQWTDDTSMALCLAESLVDRKGFDPVDQLERYVRWYRDGHMSCTGTCFDIGNTTRAALDRFESTHDPYCGSTNPYAAGNGSIMRLAPVPLFYANQPTESIERSGDSSRTTHGAVSCIDACRYMGGLIVGAVKRPLSCQDFFQPCPTAPPWRAKGRSTARFSPISDGPRRSWVIGSLRSANAASLPPRHVARTLAITRRHPPSRNAG